MPPIWGLTNKQICQKWNQLFQSNRKTNGFKDKWIVHYREEHPSEADGWEGKEKQYLEITFKCREVKCSNVWTVSRDKGLVYFFFRRNLQEDPHKKEVTKGELLIWLDYQLCSICPSTKIPEISVDGSEINAVLRYLKIKIGRLYYNIDPLIMGAEKKIEKSRKKKILATRINKETTKIHDNSNNSANTNALIKHSRGENKENINHGIQVGNKPIFPAARSYVKPKQEKKEKLQNKTAVISGSSLVPAARIKKLRIESEEMYLNRIRKQWQPIFDDIFGQLVTETNPNDKWTFDFGIIKKEEQQKTNPHLRFLDYSFGVNYRCSMCANSWGSYKPKVSFRILQNNQIDGKLGGGHVTIAIKSGQKCKFSHLQQDKEFYEKGRPKKEEIERILKLILMRIENFFYGKQLENGIKKSLKRKPKPHLSKQCENCANGDCEEVTLQ